MLLGRVIGTLVSTRKIEAFAGVKFLIVQPLDENLAPKGSLIVACDSQQAGEGQIVTYIGGREATLPLPVPFNPADALITSIVDAVETTEVRSQKAEVRSKKKAGAHSKAETGKRQIER